MVKLQAFTAPIFSILEFHVDFLLTLSLVLNCLDLCVLELGKPDTDRHILLVTPMPRLQAVYRPTPHVAYVTLNHSFKYI